MEVFQRSFVIKNKSLLDDGIKIIKKLRDAGFITFFTGGSIRDILMGKEPYDIDIATDAEPRQVGKLFKRCIYVGEQFGVVRIILPEHEFEVATFRTDSNHSDGRRPDAVFFSSPQEDARRRDLTINGLFYDPIEEKIIDYVGGIEDLENKIIRSIGNPARRISEDNLRLLRIVRFACNLDFKIEEKTWQATLKYADMISNVSIERICTELQKILTGPNPHLGFKFLFESRLLHNLPMISSFKDEMQESIYRALKYSPPYDIATALAILLTSFSDEDQIFFLENSRYSNRVKQQVQIILTRSHILFGIDELDLSQRKRIARDPLILTMVTFLKAWNQLKESEKIFNTINDFLEEREDWLKAAPEILWPNPAINGKHLLNEGYFPGPQLKVILNDVENYCLSGEKNTVTHLLRLVKKNFPLSDL
ncbi:CCA tRNA nucleotidyltransferase [Candidatus Riflebacteria bacterium]